MKETGSPTLSGRVASLHLHPDEGGMPLRSIDAIEVVADKGILGNPRYFGRPSRRQVSLIEREQISEHAVTLGLQTIAPGAVRANIETTGINLVALIGQQVQIGEAVLLFYAPRTPCYKMDAICQGLKDLMENSKQGVMAQVVQSGKIAVGDGIQVLEGVKQA